MSGIEIDSGVSENIMDWYHHVSDKLTKENSELNKDLVGLGDAEVYPFLSPGNPYLSETNFDFKISEYLIACNLHFYELYGNDLNDYEEKLLEKYRKVIRAELAGNQFKQEATYNRSEDIITVKAFPENFFNDLDRPVPKPLKLLVSITSGLGDKEFESLLLHESTHAFLKKAITQVDKESNQKFNAIDEAAARSVTYVCKGEIDSPSSKYGRQFDVDIMQTCQTEFIDLIKNSGSKTEKISKVRNKAVELQKKALKNPEKDIIEILNISLQNSRSIEELKTIKTILYLFENIEHKMFDFLLQYGFVNTEKDVYVQKLDQQLSEIGEELSQPASVLNLEEKQLILEEFKEKRQSDRGFVELLKKFGSLPNRKLQRHEIAQLEQENLEEEIDIDEIRQEFLEFRNPDKKKYLPFLKKLKDLENGIRKHYYKSEDNYLEQYEIGDYNNDLSDIAEEVHKYIDIVLKHIEGERNLRGKYGSINEEIAEELSKREKKELIGPGNRLDIKALEQEEEDLKKLFLKALEAYHQIITKFIDMNDYLMDAFEKIHGDIEIEKKRIEKEIGEGEKFINSTSIQDTRKAKDVRKYLKEAKRMDEEDTRIFDNTKVLYRIAKLADIRAKESKKILEEIDDRVHSL